MSVLLYFPFQGQQQNWWHENCRQGENVPTEIDFLVRIHVKWKPENIWALFRGLRGFQGIIYCMDFIHCWRFFLFWEGVVSRFFSLDFVIQKIGWIIFFHFKERVIREDWLTWREWKLWVTFKYSGKLKLMNTALVYVCFDVPVMPESAWSNQLFPDQVSRCLVTAIYLWQLALKKYWIMVNGRKKKWLKQLIII